MVEELPKLSFAVVVPSPPKRSTRVEREPPERDTSKSQYHTPASETIPDLFPGYRMRHSRPLTARELDTLLDTVPVPFDFSLARHHLTSHEKGGNDKHSDESSL